jgi:hypothetical protein
MQLANQTRIEIIRAELLRSFLGDIYIETAELVISNSGYYGEGLWGPLPYPYLSSLNDGVIVWLNASKYLNIQTMSNRSSQYAYVTLYYLKTAD